MCVWGSQALIVHAESVDAAVRSAVQMADDWSSVSSTSAACCWGNVKWSSGSFGMGSQRVKNASRSKVSQGDRACSGMERGGLSISVGFL